MALVNIRVQVSETYSEIFTDDIENAEVTIEDIVGTALSEVFDAIQVENVTVIPSAIHESTTVNMRVRTSSSQISEEASSSIESIVGTALSEVFDAIQVENVTVSPINKRSNESANIQKDSSLTSKITTDVEQGKNIKDTGEMTSSKELKDSIVETVVDAIETSFEAEKDGSVEVIETLHNLSSFRVGINEEPLTAQNLTSILLALTELSTKYWLIAKGRYGALIEYTQTHNPIFAEQANIIITRVSYNSPFNMDWKFDLSAPSVAEAVVKTIDGVKQRDVRLELAELEKQARAQEIKEAEQKAEQDNQKAVLEQEEQRLKLEERRLEILEKQLEMQKKEIEYAMELAGKMVDLLHPGVDQSSRAMVIQTILPNIIQLQGSKGLELALPVPQNDESEAAKGESKTETA